jgi:hypothetical protein
MMPKLRAVAASLLLISAAGCGGGASAPPATADEPPPTDTPASTTTQEATAEIAPQTPAPTTLPKREGLADDAPLVVATRALEKCDLSGSVFDVEKRCEGYAAWKKAMPSMRMKGDDKSAIDVSLLRLVRDPDVRVRQAALFSLDRAGMQFKFDADLADVLLTAAEEERAPNAGRMLGKHAARIHLDLPGVFDRVAKLAVSHPLLELRVAVAGTVLFASRMLKVKEPKKVYDLVAGLLTDKAPAVRSKAVSAFWVGTPPALAQETCKLWKSTAEDAVAKVGDEALDLLIRKPCLPEHAWALALIERRIDAKKPHVKDRYLLDALLRSKKASAANKAHAERLKTKLKSLR